MSQTNGKASQEKSQITLQNKVDIQYLQNADGKRNHSMDGFDPKFADFVDYIIRITHEIWEEKSIGKLYDYYANNVEVHTSGETLYGRDAVLAGTIATLAAYPDRRLYGDEVIWGGNDKQGFYSSHRLTHTGTNRGWTQYGPPTGNRVEYHAIADCFCKRNMVVEEWLVRDELTLIHQLGLDSIATAKEMVRKDRDQGITVQIPGDVERGIGQLPPEKMPEPEMDDFDPEYFIRRTFHEVWNWRLLNKVRDYFAETVDVESATMRKLHGWNDYQTYVLSLLAPFPDLSVKVENFCYVGDAEVGYRTATRWRMTGTHTGFGIYGEPTGNRIQILGVSHNLIQDGKIQREWTLFDEFVLLKQLFVDC